MLRSTFPRFLRQVTGLGAITMLMTTVLFAQALGRMQLTFVDEKGEPMQGVQVRVTQDSLENFLLEETSNKRGKANLIFRDATMTYHFRFEFPGYDPIEAQLKPKVGETDFQTISFTPTGGGSRLPTAQEGGQTVFTPAEKSFNEGVELLKSGQRDAATAKFKEALDRDGKLAVAHSALAGIYLESGQNDAALAAAETLVDLEPGNPRGYRLLYEANRALGKNDAAEKALKELSKLDTGGDTAAMLYNEGAEAYGLGDYAAAEARFTEALEIQPDLKPAVEGLALIHFRQKEWAAAAEAAERMLALEPDHLNSLRIRYDSYRALGDETKAEAAFQDLAKADPTTLASATLKQGEDQFNGGALEEAKGSFQKVLELDPSISKAHYYLGLCYANTQNTAEARKHLQAFLEAAPDDPDAGVAKEMLQYLE